MSAQLEEITMVAVCLPEGRQTSINIFVICTNGENKNNCDYV